VKYENDSLGNRIKEYELVSKNYLTKRIPVICRIDGKCFSTFCKRFERPYDKFFNNSMNQVMKFVCENVQGAKFAERHSDEISILITDYDKITTDSYFDYNVQKIVSVISSMATAELCRLMAKASFKQPHFGNWINKEYIGWEENWPMFDCRCFNIPKSEVANYYWWRLLDSKRNSINMLAQSEFSHKELQSITCNQMQEKLFQERQINWNDIPQGQKSGFSCKKKLVEKLVEEGPNEGQIFNRNVWDIFPSAASKSELDETLEFVFHNQ